MSLYQFKCVQAGWLKANGTPKDKKPPILDADQFDAIVAANAEKEATAKVLTPDEFLSQFK